MAANKRDNTRIDHLSNESDWFLSAIQSNGSVKECLQNVNSELRSKQDFVDDLVYSIGEKTPLGPDAVTEIGQQIRVLENTLRFRLTILSPERKGAWFRAASATTGPFKENLLSEPVFSNYDEQQHARIRAGLLACWDRRTLVDFPLRATDPSLWKVLLVLNFELESIDVMKRTSLRLSELPNSLPSYLESRAAKAFLTNVRAEIVSHRHRLTACFRTLLEASDKYWQHHATQSAQRHNLPFESHSQSASFGTRRTATTPRPKYKSSSDIEALKFMGFVEYPSSEDLKQRYHALALTMHPDRPTGNEQRFKMLTKSYRHLNKTCS